MRTASQEHHQQFYCPLYIPLQSSDTFEDSYQHHAGKRLKLEQPAIHFFPESLDTSSPFELEFSGNMHQGQLYAPHINLQTASEAPSPVTVATTLSQHSTPSRSPSRVSIISDSAPDWVLYNQDSMTQDPKDRALSSHQPPSSSQPQLSYPIQMEATLQNGYYFPTEFPKLPQYLSAQYPPLYPLPHNTHLSEDDPPALSPSNKYSSGQPSIHDGDLRSPMTPIGSPGYHDGDRASNTRTSTTREDTSISFIDEWLDESLQFPLSIDTQPKFQRTVSDAVEDELFRTPAMEMPRVQQPRQRPTNIVTSMTPNPTTYYQQAQKDHAMEARPNQLSVSRGDSPFRANSPFHPMRAPQAGTAPTRHSNFPYSLSIQSRREHQKEFEAQSMNEHLMAEAEHVESTPKTISPKDAVLEYPEPEDEASRMSLFAHDQTYGTGHKLHTPSPYSGQSMADMSDRGYGLGSSRRGSEAESLPSVGAFSYHSSPQIPMLGSNFPFHSQPLDSSAMVNMMSDNQHAKTASPIMKPEGARADSGAYSCTTPGCKQRFTTSLKLQKHRRENHRQSTPSGSAGLTSTLHGTSRHQGPHRCTRISPTTGKPCNTIFSRPYDLTRHEDTIHNTTREKVRCEICNDEKTFSRQDALTRHKKVKHGIDK